MRRAWAWIVRLLSGEPDPEWVRRQKWMLYLEENGLGPPKHVNCRCILDGTGTQHRRPP